MMHGRRDVCLAVVRDQSGAREEGFNARQAYHALNSTHKDVVFTFADSSLIDDLMLLVFSSGLTGHTLADGGIVPARLISSKGSSDSRGLYCLSARIGS